MREATEAFLGVFDRYTLADLIEPKQALAALLSSRAAPPETPVTFSRES